MLYNIIFLVLCFVVIASHPYSSATAQAPGVSTVKNGSESVPPQGQQQNCPGEPLACSHQSCGGQSGGLFKRATADPVLHGCQCCPDRTPDCESPECDGDPQQRRCKAELLHNCKCIIIPSADVDFDCDEDLNMNVSSEALQRIHERAVEIMRPFIRPDGVHIRDRIDEWH